MNKLRNFRALAFFLGFLLIIDIFVLYTGIISHISHKYETITVSAFVGFCLVTGIVLCIIQCVKCKSAIQTVAESPVEASKPKIHISKKKLIIILVAIFVIIAVVIGIIALNLTAWERNFKIKYIGYEKSSALFSSESGIYKYTITNETSKTYRNVKAVIYVENVYGNFSFEDSVGTIRQHEEKEYKLHWSSVQKAAKEKGIELFLANVDIKRLKW